MPRHAAPAPRHNRSLRALALALGLTGLICLSLAVTAQEPVPQLALSAANDTPGDPAPRGVSALPPSAPLILTIPVLGVRSSLLQLGLAADNTLAVPPPGPTYDQAAWYRYSPTPGSLGPAVISGHVDSAAQGPSVFFRLGALRPRDTVLVTRADGSVAVFAVDEVRQYPKSHFPSAAVYGNTDHPALRLITCAGRFDRAARQYLDNIVVTASLVGSQGQAPTAPRGRATEA